MPHSSPALYSLTSMKKLIQSASGSDLPMIHTPLLPHQKTGLAFLWDLEIPNGQSSLNLWATSSPGSTFNSRHIITNKVVNSLELLETNAPLVGILVDDMGSGETIQAIALIGTSKEQLITNPQCCVPTSLNHQLAIINI
ncbi:hypothetical protein O181_023398 [Austropuccinia psidii MF-1]|uniref:SNF2 N-terminal domain-containing protein n=1 Tax=Austropuccinia psidii MF-1 TaxID=1389203 RepID=A0A9Q3GX92_9BASI|nr:hypothetical protein [Austropuccinia psidii MF-1]